MNLQYTVLLLLFNRVLWYVESCTVAKIKMYKALSIRAIHQSFVHQSFVHQSVMSELGKSKVFLTDSWTGFSLVIEMAALLFVGITTLLGVLPGLRTTLAAVGVANAMALGLTGPCIVCLCDIQTSHRRLHIANVVHALPAFISALVVVYWERLFNNILSFHSLHVLFLFFLNGVVYLLIPHSKNGSIWNEKIATIYGCKNTRISMISHSIVVCIVVGVISTHY